MTGQIQRHPTAAPGVLRVTLSHPGKQNAISIAMWTELRALFEHLQAEDPATAPRAIILCGEGGHFAAGADIEEFPQFRFDEATLRAYHEDVVAPALQALLDCEIPLIAQIDGSCVGGGLEVAACCDLRIASTKSRFGVPIAKLGFPMAPGEVMALSRVVPLATLRELLLEAHLLDAPTALARGLVHRLAPPDDVATAALESAQRIAGFSTMAARLNKRTLRQLAEGGPTPEQRQAHFAYAAHPEHREGISAFLAKRTPQ